MSNQQLTAAKLEDCIGPEFPAPVSRIQACYEKKRFDKKPITISSMTQVVLELAALGISAIFDPEVRTSDGTKWMKVEIRYPVLKSTGTRYVILLPKPTDRSLKDGTYAHAMTAVYAYGDHMPPQKEMHDVVQALYSTMAFEMTMRQYLK